MKKILLMTIVLISMKVSGQSLIKGVFDRLSFGVKAGGNYSNFTNANFNTDGLSGFHAGLIMNFRLTKQLSIQEDILFSTEGAKVNDNLFNKDNIRLSYVSLPIVLKYRSRIGWYAEAGPQVNGLITDAEVAGLKPFAEKLDFGVAFGLGFQTKSGVGIGARYYSGLSNVGQFNNSTVNSDFRNQVLQASVFYVF